MRTDMTKLIVSNVPPAPKRGQRCLIQLAIALRLTERKKVYLYFPFVFPKPTTHPTHVMLLD